MSRLALYLLGPPLAELDGKEIHIGRRKTMALLSYLALENRRHSRDTLAALFWPELDTAHARGYLRRALSELNRRLDGQAVDADRETVSLNPEVVVWVDASAFRELLATCEAHGHPHQQACTDCMVRLSEALDLYRGDFMAGFSFPDSLAFDEWHRYQSAQLRDELEGVLERLIAGHCALAEHEQAIAITRRWLEMDPLHEPAHRTLIALLAQTGRRAAALRQYQECLRALEEEFGIPPAAETTALYEHIAASQPQPSATPGQESLAFAPPDLRPSPQLPGFLREEAAVESERPAFVARERELAQLDAYLEGTRNGKGGLVFVTGGPGRGKTALMGEFARRAMDTHDDLLVGMGSCNAYSGIGDPYLPFRGVLSMLTGDVESRWAAGAISREGARRTWAAMPQAIQALLARGPALMDIFVSGPALLSRAAGRAPDRPPWLGRLENLVEAGKAQPGELAQSQLFESYTEVLRALAAQHPLLLLLDDLQWADNASISLLFHLGRELADGGARILIVGAYRPDEVALGRPASASSAGRERERHPLEKVLAELRRRYGDAWVDLARADEAEGRPFVDALIDTEPNRLDEGFREALLRHTGGHPLFTVELLRAMQERGDLVKDGPTGGDGAWIQGPALDWDGLPARVEAVIEQRIRRLDDKLRDALSIASVEGETFTAQVVARVGEMGERQLLRALSQELEKRHRLVREGELSAVGANRLSRYRFAHALYQAYLYNGLGAGERALLHQEVGDALETLYAGCDEEILPQLAHHYAEAGTSEKAIDYLIRAGDQARLAYAHAEPADHYRRALGFLKERGEYHRAARTLMKLGLTHHNAFQFQRARQAYDEGFDLWQRVGEAAPAVAMPPAPHALRLSLGTLHRLDPATAMDGGSTWVISHLFSALVELTPERDVVPDLARSWEVRRGGREYVFQLQQDARWSDGVPVTAGDFEYAWKRCLDPELDAPRASELYGITGARAYHQERGRREDVGVRASDTFTLVVELEAPNSLFLDDVAGFRAVPRHVLCQHGDHWTEPANIVTCGPFQLESWKPGQSLILARNPAYHGQFTGNVERVEYDLSRFGGPDRFEKALQIYELDGLDVIQVGGTTLHGLDRARQRHAGEYITVPAYGLQLAGFDLGRPPFDDARVRQAFTMAVDRERLAGVVCRGYHDPPTGGLVPPGVPAHSPGIGLPYDPARARQLLAQAGYPGGRGFPAVEVLVQSGWSLPFREFLGTAWRENLGVEINWEIVDFTDLVTRLTGHLPPPLLYLASWTGGLDPSGFVEGLFHQRWARSWQNPAYAELLRRVGLVRDQGERIELYRAADRILVQEAPAVPLVYEREHLLVKPWVVRYPLTSTKFPLLKHVVIGPH
jgi:ABC-type oligopeptide transport system substrate-binding subunit/DNA-binding SARP family transcriptional activator